MKDFKKRGFGGKPSFSGRPDYKKKTWDKPKNFGGDRQMFDATCSGCGKSCQVPFRPSEDKEVFCNNCFGKTKGDDFRGGFDSRAPRAVTGGQNIDAVVRQLQVVASKLDQLIVIMNTTAKASKPTSEKPAAPTVIEVQPPVVKKTTTKEKSVTTKRVATPKKVVAKKATSKKK